MTIRDIQHHLVSTIGTELSHETISNLTEAVADKVKEWQARPLEAFYPVMYLDAIVVKIRDGAYVSNKAAHIAVGVDMSGVKHVLGIWVQASEGAKFWAGVCAELANRGVKDVLIVCCDGLTGLPEAIEATWSRAMVQTCVVHLIRAAMRFVSYADRKAVVALLRPIYTAPNEDAALIALATFTDSNLGKKYPAAVATWENAWQRFTPFLAFSPALRKLIYTTNAIVISSRPGGVVPVRHGCWRASRECAGRGYLRSVHNRDWPEVRCSYRGWPYRGRGLSRGRCSVRTTRRSSRSRGTCLI